MSLMQVSTSDIIRTPVANDMAIHHNTRRTSVGELEGPAAELSRPFADQRLREFRTNHVPWHNNRISRGPGAET